MRVAIDIRRAGDFGIGTYIRNLLRQLADDLRRRGDRALLCRERGEGLHQLCVAFVLARVGLLQGLLGGGEVGGQLRAVAAVGAPGGEDSDR